MIQKSYPYHTSRKTQRSMAKDSNIFNRLSMSFYDRKTIKSQKKILCDNFTEEGNQFQFPEMPKLKHKKQSDRGSRSTRCTISDRELAQNCNSNKMSLKKEKRSQKSVKNKKKKLNQPLSPQDFSEYRTPSYKGKIRLSLRIE